MKQLIKHMMVIFCLAIAFTLVATPQDAQAAVHLNKSVKAIKAGTSYKLKLSGTSRKAKWYSSDESIATVSSNGRVTGVSPGRTMVVAKIGDKKYKCQISVVFNAEIAGSNITTELQECNTSVVALFDNNNTFAVIIKGWVTFYDINEDEIKTVKQNNYCFEGGTKSALVFEKPEGAVSYKFKYDITKCFYTGLMQYAVFDYDQGTDYVVGRVTNEGEKLITSYHCTLLMYDAAGNLIYAKHDFENLIYTGETSSCRFKIPKDIYQNYTIADCKVILNSAYCYG